MIFTTSLFMFMFLPIVLIGYTFADTKYKNGFLLIASLFFYAWGEPVNILLMIVLILINYFVGWGFELCKSNIVVKKVLLVFALLVDFGVLFRFKYLGFFCDIINQWFNIEVSANVVALPIGLSFFTFQIVSYVVDVYRETVPVQKKVHKLALYILLYPQLIAGPIVRYQDIEKQLESRETTSELFYEGARRFMLGFSKKVLIADMVGQVADVSFNNLETGYLAWIGMLAYTIQIYYDFSGYSDMAIGMGKMFGFHFNENFNYPYISKSVKEFWRRWHISLSTWFRDYVYIPLGGSRCSFARGCFNLLVVFFCTGLWHGASWNFIFWGIYYAIILLIERIIDKIKQVKGTKIEKQNGFVNVLKWLCTITLVMIGWVFFRSNTMGEAVQYIKNLIVFEANGIKELIYNVDFEKTCALICGVIFSFPLFPIIEKKCNKISFVLDAIICVIFMIAILYMVGNSYSPFLYFRF